MWGRVGAGGDRVLHRNKNNKGHALPQEKIKGHLQGKIAYLHNSLQKTKEELKQIKKKQKAAKAAARNEKRLEKEKMSQKEAASPGKMENGRSPVEMPMKDEFAGRKPSENDRDGIVRPKVSKPLTEEDKKKVKEYEKKEERPKEGGKTPEEMLKKLKDHAEEHGFIVTNAIYQPTMEQIMQAMFKDCM